MIILKIIGVLLLIILILIAAALCIPVCVGIKYDGATAITIKYLFLRLSKQFGGDGTEAEQTAKEPTIFSKIVSSVSGFLKKSWHSIKRGCSKAAQFIKRTFRRLKAAVKKAKSKSRKKKRRGSGSSQSSKTRSTEQSLFGSLREERGFWGAIKFFADLGKLMGGCLVRIYRGIAVNQFVLRAEIVGEDAADTAIKYGEVCAVAFPALSYLLGSARRYSQDIEITPNFDSDEGRIYFEGEFVIFPVLVLWHALCALVKFVISQIKFTVKNQKKG